jgi:hypothetical protein
MAEDPNKLISDLKKLQKEYTALTSKKAPLFDTSDVENTKNAIESISTSIEKAKEEALRLESGFNGVYGEIQGIVSELSSTESATKKVEKAFKGISSITRDLRNDQNGLYQLSLKDLKKRQEKLRDLDAEARYQADIVAQRYEGTKAQQTGLLYGKDNKILNEGALKVRAKSLGITVKQLENDAAILVGKKEEFKALTDVNIELEKRIKKEEQINELMGLGGAAVEAVGGALDKLGMSSLKNALGLNEVQDEMRSIAEERLEEIKEGLGEGEEATLSFGDKMAVLKGGIKEAGKQLIQNLKDPLAIAGFLATQLIDALMSVDKQTGELAKNFGISYDAALGLKSELTSAANQSYLLNINSQGLVESFTTLNNLFGTFGQINEQVLEDFSRLTSEAFLSNEAASALYKTTILTGKGLEDSTKEFAGQAQALAMQNGLALNQKQILESVQNISTATLLQLQGQPEALAEAVVNAKALGLSLDKVEQIASSLLDFENSISAEMEAELLTGKQLNLEKARQAALDGDIATVAEEIAKQVGTAAQFTEMNVIQQEALAKSVGITRDDLAKSLMEREAMAKLSDQEGKTAQEKFNNLVKEVGMEEAKKQLGDEQLANLYSQQNVQERFAAAVEKLKDVFIAIAEPVLQIVSPFVDLVTTILPAVNFLLTPITEGVKVLAEGFGYIVNSVKSLFGFFTGSNKELDKMQFTVGAIASFYLAIKGYALATKVLQGASLAIEAARGGIAQKRALLESRGLVKQVGSAIFSVISSFSKIPFGVGVGLGLVAAAGIASMASKYLKGDDVMSPGDGSGYGKRTLMGPEGAIALNNKDTVIAGTNLFGGGKEKMEAPQNNNISPQNNNISIDISPLVERMSAVENVLIQILNKEGDVYMDGAKVGKSLTLATSKVG